MSNAAMNAVWKRSQATGVSRLVLLAMADEANDEGFLTAYGRSQSHLASKAKCSVNAVRTAIKKLAGELREVEVLAPGVGRQKADYRLLLVADDWRPPSNRVPSDQGDCPNDPRGQTPSAEGSDPLETPPPSPPSVPVSPRLSQPLAGSTPSAPPDDGGKLPGVDAPSKPGARAGKRASNPEATRVTKAIWDARDPKPTGAFVGVQQIVGQLLEAGWPASEIECVGIAAPVLTRNALELGLNRARQPVKAAAGALGKENLDDKITAFRNRKNPKPPVRGDFIDVKETRNGR